MIATRANEVKVQSTKNINHHYTQTQQSATERGNYNNFYYSIARWNHPCIINSKK